MRKLFSRLSSFTFTLLVLAFVMGLASKIVSPKLIWPLAFAGLGFPIVILLAFILAVFYISKKSKKALQPVFLLTVAFFVVPEFFNIIEKTIEPLEDSIPIKVMSYNVRNFEAYDKTNKINKRDSIFTLIKKEQPDIICFQEAFVSNQKFTELPSLKKALHMPYVHFEAGTEATSGQFGVAVFSKYPIQNTTSYKFGSGGNVGTKVDITLNEQEIAVFNVHLESANIENKYYNYSSEEIQELSKKQFIARGKQVTKQLKRAFIARAKQAELIRKEIKSTKSPIIVCGDFNDTPMSYAYQTVKGNLYDTFKAGRFGIGVTYPAIPFMRIDHILASKEWNILSHKIIKAKISDHYPVVVELELNSK